MWLKNLSITNFRNIAEAQIELNEGINAFVGENGMGKTNVLDAIYYLSFCKSQSGAPDAYVIRHDADFFAIQGEYVSTEKGNMSEHILCSLKRGGRKRVKRGAKFYNKLSEHIGAVPLVMISPADADLVSEGGDARRRFMNSVISQYDAAYLASAMRYERALKQRNALLRESSEPDEAIMDVLEDMMSADAQVICDARRAYAEGFAPIFRELYSQISGRDAELAQVEYSIQTQPSDLREKLRTMRERERIVGHTLYGPHRDDLLLTLGGYAIKREGSQGQIKTFFVSMKLSQFLFLKRTIAGRIPILLLDDIFDKLDAGRVERIIRLVTQSEFGQIFITDTNRGHLDTILAASAQGYRLFNVADGILNGCE